MLVLNGLRGLEQRVIYSEWLLWGLLESTEFLLFQVIFFWNFCWICLYLCYLFKTMRYLCSRYLLSAFYLANFICLLAFYFIFFTKRGFFFFWLIELNRNDPERTSKLPELGDWLNLVFRSCLWHRKDLWIDF